MHPFFNRFHDAWHRRHEHHGMHRGHRGFAGFGESHGFGGSARGGLSGFGRGRKLGSADLQLLLLALLSDRPSHGYELIKALEERSKGYYSPSPGMVYPALTYLEEIGYASVESDGARKLYSITVAGLAHLEEQRASVDAILAQLAFIGARMDHLKEAMAEASDLGEDVGVGAFHRGRGSHRGRTGDASADIRTARRSVKAALLAKANADADEQRRIAAILERAAADILGAGAPG